MRNLADLMHTSSEEYQKKFSYLSYRPCAGHLTELPTDHLWRAISEGCGSFCLQRLTLIPTWIRNYCHNKVWVEKSCFHPTLYWVCDYLSMLELRSIHVSKGGTGSYITKETYQQRCPCCFPPGHQQSWNWLHRINMSTGGRQLPSAAITISQHGGLRCRYGKIFAVHAKIKHTFWGLGFVYDRISCMHLLHTAIWFTCRDFCS